MEHHGLHTKTESNKERLVLQVSKDSKLLLERLCLQLNQGGSVENWLVEFLGKSQGFGFDCVLQRSIFYFTALGDMVVVPETRAFR